MVRSGRMQAICGDWACAGLAGGTPCYARRPERCRPRVFGIFGDHVRAANRHRATHLRGRRAGCGERCRGRPSRSSGSVGRRCVDPTRRVERGAPDAAGGRDHDLLHLRRAHGAAGRTGRATGRPTFPSGLVEYVSPTTTTTSPSRRARPTGAAGPGHGATFQPRQLTFADSPASWAELPRGDPGLQTPGSPAAAVRATTLRVPAAAPARLRHPDGRSEPHAGDVRGCAPSDAIPQPGSPRSRRERSASSGRGDHRVHA